MKKKWNLFFVITFAFITMLRADPLIEGLRGSGSEQDPVIIGSVSDLRTLSAFVMNGAMGNNATKDAHFKMTNDLIFEDNDILYDLDGDGTKESNFIPIGGRSAEKTASDWHNFQGIFDGDGHTIRGLRILYGAVNYVGLFGQSYGGSIYRVGIEDGMFSGNGSVGSLCGLGTGADVYGFPGTTIKECFARNVSVKGSWWSVGGLVGATYTDDVIETVVENCYVAEAYVCGTDFVGGFCGNNNGNSEIKNCYFFGEVESIEGTLGNYGGFAGQAKTDGTTILNISNCYYNEDWKLSENVSTASFALAGLAKTSDFMQSDDFIDLLNSEQTMIWQTCEDKLTPALYWESCTSETSNEHLNKSAAGSLNVFPNPVTDGTLNVVSKEGGEYFIFTLSGKCIEKGQIAGNADRIDTRALKTGVYVLQVTNENTCEQTKIVVR